MKSLLLRVFLSVVFAASLIADENGWISDYAKALEKAKAEKKLILIDFTGSDWCGWCIKLNKEVFSQSQFKDYAKKNLVLLEIDFPRRKSQPAQLKKQNKELAQKYNVDGYPTIIVLDSDGKQIGTLGYMQGGASHFVAALEKLKV